MVNACPKCGAVLKPGEECRQRFELCLVKDYEHPSAYGAVHHLVVACYMLQHNEYSRQGWLEARKLVAQAVGEGESPANLRAQIQPGMEGGQRQWHITRGEKIAEIDSLDWTRTITDVRLDTAEEYCASVQRWAESVLVDTEPVVQKLASEV